MLSGDFRTFPISDLLQWLDQSRKAGVLEIERPLGRSFWIEVADREIVSAAPPSSINAVPLPLAPWQPSAGLLPLWPEICRDRILDLFFTEETPSSIGDRNGRFTFADQVTGYDGGVALSLSVGESVFDGLRRLDEWPELDRRYPDERAGLMFLAGAEESPLQNALLEAARAGLSLSEVRLSLGLSRAALLNRIAPLEKRGALRVERSGEFRPDPIARLLRQVELLVREQQLDEAAHVLASLMAAEVAEPRAVALWNQVERQLIAAFYAQHSPLCVPRLRPEREAAQSKKLTSAEKELAERINGRMDLTALLLAMPRGEAETLRSLRRLLQLGVVELVRPKS